MKRKAILYVFSGLTLVSMLSSCGGETSSSSGTSTASEIYAVYEAYKASGGTLSYDEWLASIKGEKGDKGDEGASIIDTKIDENGHLIITLSNGKTIDAGQVKEASKHTVNFYIGGEIEKSIEVADGGKIEEPSKDEFPGCSITSWHTKEDGGEKWDFGLDMVKGDLNLYAFYTPNTYSVTLKDDEFGLGDKFYTLTYKESYDFTGAYSKDGYSYTLLDSDGDSYPLKGKWTTAKDMVLNVTWLGLSHSLTLISNSSKAGSAAITEGNTRYNEKVTVTATPNEGYAFYGWYNGDELLSYESVYTFSMPNEDLTLQAAFLPESEMEKVSRFAMRPTLSEDKKSVTYGIYPQTHVGDKETINGLKEAEHMQGKQYRWIQYNGDYYAKVTAAPHGDATDYIYSDSTVIAKDSEDWFKCEPIKWNIAESDEGVYTLYSDLLLDYQQYATTDSANDYYSSYLRNYLTNSFIYSAFSYDRSFLRETNVNVTPMDSNSCEGSSSGHKACSDKVFPLSMVDYRFGLESGSSEGIISDYARALGAERESSASYHGAYWTSTPTRDSTSEAFCISASGGKQSTNVTSYACLRPAIQVKIPTL